MAADGDEDGSAPEAVPAFAAINHSRRQAGISMERLWLSYFELTGDASPLELDAYLHGSLSLPALQVDILRQAVVECAPDGPPPSG